MDGNQSIVLISLHNKSSKTIEFGEKIEKQKNDRECACVHGTPHTHSPQNILVFGQSISHIHLFNSLYKVVYENKGTIYNCSAEHLMC